mgnify:CR=1 FL=1
MAYEDNRTILIRRVHNRIDDAMDIQGPILSYLAEVIVDDGKIPPELRWKYANHVPTGAYDLVEKVWSEEKNRADLCERISARISKGLDIPRSTLNALIYEVVDEGEITGAARRMFASEVQPEFFDLLEDIANEEMARSYQTSDEPVSTKNNPDYDF